MWNAPRTLKVRGEVWRRGRRGHALRRPQRKRRGSPGRGAGCSTSGPRSPPPPSCLRAQGLTRAGTEPGRPAEVSLKAAELLALFRLRAFLTRLVKAGNRLQERARSANGPGSQSGLKLCVCAFPSGGSRQLPKARFQTRTPSGQRLSSPPRSGGSAPELPAGPGRLPAPRPRAVCRGKPTYLPSRPGHPRSPQPLYSSPREARPWISKRALPSWSSRANPRPGSPADNRAGCPWERASALPPSSSACPALPRGRSAPAPASCPAPPAGKPQPPPGPSSRDRHPERGGGARPPTAAAPRRGRAPPPPGPGPGPGSGRAAAAAALARPLRALSPPPGAGSRGEAAGGQARSRGSCRHRAAPSPWAGAGAPAAAAGNWRGGERELPGLGGQCPCRARGLLLPRGFPPPARATSPRQGSLRCYKGVGVSASELSPEAARWRGAGSRGSGRGEKSERNSTGQGVTCCWKWGFG